MARRNNAKEAHTVGGAIVCDTEVTKDQEMFVDRFVPPTASVHGIATLHVSLLLSNARGDDRNETMPDPDRGRDTLRARPNSRPRWPSSLPSTGGVVDGNHMPARDVNVHSNCRRKENICLGGTLCLEEHLPTNARRGSANSSTSRP